VIDTPAQRIAERLRHCLKGGLPNTQVQRLVAARRALRGPSRRLRRLLWPAINARRLKRISSQRDLRLHLGCSEIRLDGFINVDVRLTDAVDLTLDLNRLRLTPGSVGCVYSNAFFEHLLRTSQLDHLEAVAESLDPSTGFVCYTGIPYFRNIAKFYLEGAPGTAGPVFDLYNVYRYTHGDPDRMPTWYYEQLHKSLFDETVLSELLERSSLRSYAMFVYAFPGDVNEVPVNMGFYATSRLVSAESIERACIQFLQDFDGRFVRLATVEFIHG